MLEVDNEVALFGKFSRYFNLYEQTPLPKVKLREFSAKALWENVKDGTYLYVVLPPTPNQQVRVRLSFVPLEVLLDSAISHEDLALIKTQEPEHVSPVLSAGLIRVLDGEIVTVDLNSGHFKPGKGRREKEDQALQAAQLALKICQAPLTKSTTFSHFRDRNSSPSSR